MTEPVKKEKGKKENAMRAEKPGQDGEVVLDENTSLYIRRQVEFYFSDSNLPRDAFLRGKVEENEEKKVEIAVLASFSKLRAIYKKFFRMSLPEAKPGSQGKYEVPESIRKALTEALRPSEFLELSADGTKVGRKDRLAKEDYGKVLQEVDQRTLHVSPISSRATMGAIRKLFSSEEFGGHDILSVRLGPSEGKKAHSGFAYVEFKTHEKAQEFAKEYDGKIEMHGAKLSLALKEEHFRKVKERNDGFVRAESKGLLAKLVFKEDVGVLDYRDIEEAFDSVTKGTHKDYVEKTVAKDVREDTGSKKVYYVILKKRDEATATFLKSFEDIAPLKIKVKSSETDVEATLQFVSKSKDEVTEEEMNFWISNHFFHENKRKRKGRDFSAGSRGGRSVRGRGRGRGGGRDRRRR
ncbi:MAG: hypothetical protein CMJ52_08595 [Planctomycetaceae bacterium]|nr:hypothetical protein [Planctomycetaceae bacterium]